MVASTPFDESQFVPVGAPNAGPSAQISQSTPFDEAQFSPVQAAAQQSPDDNPSALDLIKKAGYGAYQGTINAGAGIEQHIVDPVLHLLNLPVTDPLQAKARELAQERAGLVGEDKTFGAKAATLVGESIPWLAAAALTGGGSAAAEVPAAATSIAAKVGSGLSNYASAAALGAGANYIATPTQGPQSVNQTAETLGYGALGGLGGKAVGDVVGLGAQAGKNISQYYGLDLEKKGQELVQAIKSWTGQNDNPLAASNLADAVRGKYQLLHQEAEATPVGTDGSTLGQLKQQIYQTPVPGYTPKPQVSSPTENWDPSSPLGRLFQSNPVAAGVYNKMATSEGYQSAINSGQITPGNMSDLHALQQTLDSQIKWGVNPATAPVDNLSVRSLKSARAAVNNIGIATDPRFGQYSDAWSGFFQTKANPVENNTNIKSILNPNATTGSIISGANGLTNISSAQAAQEGQAARDILFPNGHPAVDQSVASQLMDKAGKLPLDMPSGEKAYRVLNNQDTFDALSSIYKNQPEKLQQIQNMQQLAQQYGNASRNYKNNSLDLSKVGDWGGALKSIFGASTDTSLAPQVAAAVTINNPNTRLNAFGNIIRQYAVLHSGALAQPNNQQQGQ